MIDLRKGFTIVELMIVVAIIAILTSISVFMYNNIQKDARDTERSSKITVIAEALEKYYSQNGEYPGCSAMTQSGTAVSSNVLKGIDTKALLVPNSAAGVTNSITCAAITATGPDAYRYVGDGTATCNTGTACTKYTLQYIRERTTEIVSVDSKYQ